MDKHRDWIGYIKEDGEEALTELYRLFKPEFISWSASYFQVREEEGADAFQDAVITFYWNVKQDKLTELTSSVKTYLFAIGKNLVLKKIKKDKRLVIDNEVSEYNAHFNYEEVSMECTERQDVIQSLLSNLGEPCRSILRMFYFDRYTMDSIAQRLNYKNEHVVKTQKLRCLQQLRKMAKEHSLDQEDI